MIILISGTPGVGKTTIAKELAKKIKAEIVDIKDIARKYRAIEGYDIERKSMEINIKKLKKAIEKELDKKGNYIIDSHIAHLISPKKIDVCFILRLDPKELEKRLKRRAYPKSKIEENVMAEKLDVCLIEAINEGLKRKIHEIDTTRKSKKKIVKEMIDIIKKKKKKSYGNVSWLK